MARKKKSRRPAPKSNPARKRARKEAAEAREKAKGAGRPIEYHKSYAEDVRRLCLLGATDEELAAFIGITVETLHDWKRKHPEFSEAIKNGKERADAQVAERLFQRAMGYEHAAVKIFADAKTGAVEKVSYIERYAPDTAACIFWLKNRQKENWRDKQELEHGGTPGKPIESKVTMSPDEAYLAMLNGTPKK